MPPPRKNTRQHSRNGYQRAIWQGIEKTIPHIQFESIGQLTHYFHLAAAPLSFAEVTDAQRMVMMGLAANLPLSCKLRAAESWGNFPPWEGSVLKYRMDVFRQAAHRQYPQAQKDYLQWQQAMKRRGLEVAEDGTIR